MYFRAEDEDVREILIAELASSLVPMAIMAVTFIGVGVFVSVSLAMPSLMAVTLLGGLIVSAKLILILMHGRQNRLGRASRALSTLWERVHAATTIGFAVTVGAISGTTFVFHNLTLQMLTTALVFGYCSGIVCRMAIRPYIAMAAMSVAALPLIVCAAFYGDPPHWAMAAIFAVFLLGSAETVRYMHTSALRQIGLRLDMATLARNDPLTGLANRLGLREVFRESIQTTNAASKVAVHFLDLDRFKPVNDRYGHAAGDEVLRQIANRLRSALRESDVAARIGGDEFVVLQKPVHNAEHAKLYADNLLNLLVEPYLVGEQVIEIGVSMGYVVSTEASWSLDHLLHEADTALYSVKRSGGGVLQA